MYTCELRGIERATQLRMTEEELVVPLELEWTRFRGHLSAWSAVSDLAGRIGVHVQDPVSSPVPA
jgi:hypothetical protein